MHTSSAPAELDLPATPGTAVAPAESLTTPPGRPRATSNHLTLKQTSLLYIWLDQAENRDYVAKESDADTAIKAAEELGFPVSTGNITGTRKALEIAKIKPEKPADPPADVDLITLQQQLRAQGQEIEAIKIDATNTRDAYNLLVAHVQHLQQILENNEDRLAPLPYSTFSQFKDLKPLAPLPAPEPLQS